MTVTKPKPLIASLQGEQGGPDNQFRSLELGRNLGLATSAYNDFVGSLESQVLTQAKRFETLKVETGGRTIEPVPMIDTTARQLNKLDPTELPEAAE